MADKVMIYIPLEEYSKLRNLEGRVAALVAYISKERYSVKREMIASMLNFEFEDVEE